MGKEAILCVQSCPSNTGLMITKLVNYRVSAAGCICLIKSEE